jgi:hypothetical protein
VVQTLFHQPAFLSCASNDCVSLLSASPNDWEQTLTACTHELHSATTTTTTLFSPNSPQSAQSAQSAPHRRKKKHTVNYGWSPITSMCANVIALRERRNSLALESSEASEASERRHSSFVQPETQNLLQMYCEVLHLFLLR